MKSLKIIVLNKKNITDFSRARNEALKKAKTDWVLFVDSDEKLSPALGKEIKNLKPGRFFGFYLIRKNYFLGKFVGRDKILRLAKRNSGFWQRQVHETWQVRGKIGTLKNPIIHQTAGSIKEMISKINHYSILHALANLKEGKHSGLDKIILWPKLKFCRSLLSGKGLILSFLMSFHSFLAWSKLWMSGARPQAPFMSRILLFCFLVVFPFGRLLGNSLDIVAGLIFLFTLLSKLKEPPVFKFWKNFLFAAGFSWIFSSAILGKSIFFPGLLYLIRLLIYSYLFVFIKNYFVQNIKQRKLLLNTLLATVVFIGLFGLWQYFFYPDLTALNFLGWDDHLYRLTAPFFDPGFTAILLVLGAIIAFWNRSVLVFLILTLALAFTYSRAGYLAFLSGLVLTAILTKKWKAIGGMIVAFLIILAFLPRQAGLGVRLERTVTAFARIQNYKEGLAIFKKSPVFGVGFNNLCRAKQVFFNESSLASHSCSGLDSSLLLVLATTGTVGFIIFGAALIRIFHALKINTLDKKIFLVSFVTVLVHSLFVNSLFYPWVMGWLAILGAVADS